MHARCCLPRFGEVNWKPGSGNMLKDKHRIALYYSMIYAVIQSARYTCYIPYINFIFNIRIPY